MTKTAPPIEHFTRRLSECPPEFLENQVLELEVFAKAVLFDLLQALDPSPNVEALEGWLSFPRKVSKGTRKKALRLYLISAWLLYDPFFREAGVSLSAVGTLLEKKLARLAEVQAPLTFIEDRDRREELSRLILAHFGYLPHGEKAEFAADRLATLDSIERHALILDARRKAEHAEKVRKKIAAEEARAAAARWNRE